MSLYDLEREENADPVDETGPATDDSPVDGSSEVTKEKARPRRLRNFFLPPRSSSRWRRILPWGTVVVVVIAVSIGIAYAWTYTNSPEFCGKTCHTMPPEYAAYELSPHSRVRCVECHIGRDFIGEQVSRKAGDLKHVIAVTFKTYEYPIYARGMRPAPQICEKCHSPAKFSDESLRINAHYNPDQGNSLYNIYLILKTGGGTKAEGLGRGIHWHIENKVEFFSMDKLDQNIPYIRVSNDDGSITEYVDIASNFKVSSVASDDLQTMDCITCHNRITHTVPRPDRSVEGALARGVISSDIPYIFSKGVEVLSAEYPSQEDAFAAIATLDEHYRNTYPFFYSTEEQKVKDAIAELQRIYSVSVFADQEIDWDTHPDNIGHMDYPGCFRCHDGKHLNEKNEAIRLECNLCHSVPVVTQPEDFVANIEISLGPEPDSHRNPNWITLHREVFDSTCTNCHTVEDAGGTSDTSFCSNSACHGTVYQYAGFDAPALRAILREQLPSSPPAGPPPGAADNPTFDSYVGPVLNASCGVCHGSSASAGLDLTTYASTMKGGTSGPAVVPGDSAGSRLVQAQSTQHFANFSSAELATIKKWIDAGAPEK